MPPRTTAKTRLLEATMQAIWERSYAATSVDVICERADVRKGSFYHFFKSKAELGVAALTHLWETKSQPSMEEIFSSDRPPLERFERMMEYWYHRALNAQREFGRVLGCPYFNLGAEAAGVEPELTAKAREILDAYQRYLEETLKEASERGDIEIADPHETAACIFSMVEGCSTQARIHDDPERVRLFADALGRIIGAELSPDLSNPNENVS